MTHCCSIARESPRFRGGGRRRVSRRISRRVSRRSSRRYLGDISADVLADISADIAAHRGPCAPSPCRAAPPRTPCAVQEPDTWTAKSTRGGFGEFFRSNSAIFSAPDARGSRRWRGPRRRRRRRRSPALEHAVFSLPAMNTGESRPCISAIYLGSLSRVFISACLGVQRARSVDLRL